MSQILKALVYDLERRYPAKIKVGRHIEGEIDYGGDSGKTVATTEHNIKAITLPLNIARNFAKQTKVSFETYDTNYIIKCASLTFALRPGDYIIADNKRYNIKVIDMIETYCYLVGANSILGETHE